jgi:acylglycerol lipase
MKHSNLSWKTNDSIDIFAQKWEGADKPKAVICLIHGMGEHSSRYAHWAERFVEKGYAVIAFDQRGHGKSGGNRGHAPSFDVLFDDVTIFLNKAKENFPDNKYILYGHSMGGAVVSNYLIHRQPQITGAVLSSPYFRMAFEAPKLKIQLGRWMEDLLPKLALPTGLNADHISRDKKEVDIYKKDKLVHDKISAKMGMQLIDNGEYAIAHAKEIKIPTLLIHGTGDQLTSHLASKEFLSNAGSNISAKFYDGLYHEMHHEPERDEVFKDILAFVETLV